MTLKTGIGTAALVAALAVACTSVQKGGRGIAGIFDPKGAREFTDADAARLSSTGAMKASEARVITDNFEAYKSKIDIIEHAQKSLRLVYFIYSDDSSSAQITDALIRAANRGVKVQLLVDFLTNYPRIDLFKYMEKAGKGNIQVNFYGIPSEAIVRGALYQTTACSPANAQSKDSEACEDEKQAKVEALEKSGVKMTWFSKMYLTGQYSKNDKLQGVAVQMGGGIDINKLKQSSGGPKPSGEQTKELAQLVYKAKAQNQFFAKVKLGFALAKYGDSIGPILNQIFGAFPFALGGGPDYDHMTDYTHHKLIVADGKVFQMGGRNVEDSYHTDMYSEKYTFIDTDFYAKADVAIRVEKAYDTLWNFKAMVGDMATVDKLTPNEYPVNTMQFLGALDGCVKAATQNPALAAGIEQCVDGNISKVPGYQTMDARMNAVAAKIRDGKKAFLANYKPQERYDWNPNNNIQDADAEMFYLENTSFNRDVDASKRLFGSQVDFEHENGKNIHAVWIRGIENACAVSARTGQPKRVVLHSAYFLMSSGLVAAVGNALNGKWDCHNVQIDLITNSFATTDLNVLNVFARYQLASLFNYYYYGASANKAKLNYYEYIPHNPDPKCSKPQFEKTRDCRPNSLHSKVTVIGDDIVIGSANADVRSYYMDTNNAILIRNAPKLVADYLAFIDKLPKPDSGRYYKMWPGALTVPQVNEQGQVVGADLVGYSTVTKEQLDRHTRVIVEAMAAKWLVPKPIKAKIAKGEALTAEEQQEMKDLEKKKVGIRMFVNERGDEIQEATLKFLKGEEREKDMRTLANDFDEFYKFL